MPYYKYRTDLGNTVTAKSPISFSGMTGNEAQISSTIDTPEGQQLYLYKVSAGLLVENDDTTMNSYFAATGIVVNGSPTMAQFTGYTATTKTIYYKYNAGSAPTQYTANKIFVGQATTNSSGVATFHMTTNGLSGGTAIFTTIHSIEVIAENNTSSVSNIPLVSIKAITGGKSVSINVLNPLTIILGGLGLTFAGSGVNVHMTARGI